MTLASVERTYYEVLDVAPDSDLATIKKAYREKILSTHPDKLVKARSEEKNAPVPPSNSVSLIKRAYDTLSNPDLRTQYDTDLNKASQVHGFNLNGDGLDSYSLETFRFEETEVLWIKNCPRCQTPDSIRLTETDLEQGTDDGEGGLELLVQCGSCSLWIKVHYLEEEEEEEEEEAA